MNETGTAGAAWTEHCDDDDDVKTWRHTPQVYAIAPWRITLAVYTYSDRGFCKVSSLLHNTAAWNVVALVVAGRRRGGPAERDCGAGRQRPRAAAERAGSHRWPLPAARAPGPPWGPVPGGDRAQPSRPALQHSPGSSVAPTCTGTPLTSPRYLVPLLSLPPRLVDSLALICGAEFSCFSPKRAKCPQSNPCAVALLEDGRRVCSARQKPRGGGHPVLTNRRKHYWNLTCSKSPRSEIFAHA